MTPATERLAGAEAAGRRLDEVVAELAGTSRAQAARWASDGLVAVDGRPRPKSHRLRGGERLAWTPPEAPPGGEPQAEERPLAVRYEDDDVETGRQLDDGIDSLDPDSAEAVARAPLWDVTQLAPALQVLQGHPATRINDLDLDRYDVDGELRPVMVAARSREPE